MTDKSIDPAVILKTQEILGKFVKKPALTEKLLNKPPFRFLHDIINVVIRDTGHFKGLYTNDELISDNVKERDAKIQFLQKLIDVTQLTTESKLSARPTKIAAGQEPEKTNELLQQIGIIIDKKLDTSSAIQRVLHGKIETSKEKSSNKKKANVISANNELSKDNKEEKKILSTKSNKSNVTILQKSKGQEKPEVPIAKEKELIKKLSTERDKKDDIKSKRDKGISKKDEIIKKTSVRINERNKEKEIVKLANRKEVKVSTVKKIEKQDKKDQNVKTVMKNAQDPVKIIKEEEKLEKLKPVTDEMLKEEARPKLDKEPMKIEETIESNTKTQETVLQKKVNEEIPERRKSSSSSSTSSKREKLKKSENSEPLDYLKTEAKEEPRIVSKSLIKTPDEFPRNELIAVTDEEAEKRRTNIQKEDSVVPTIRPRNSGKRHRPKPENDIKPIKAPEASGPVVQTTSSNQNDQEHHPVIIKRQNTFIRENSELDKTRITSLRPPSVRPASARPGAPRRRNKNVEIILQPNEQIQLAGINVKIETFNAELEDDGENLVIIENSNEQNLRSENFNEITDSANVEKKDENQGHLVQQILETQKELVQNDGKNQNETDVDSNISLLQKRQSSAKQMDSLRESIQVLTRSVNPLGKLMDFLPEDMDSMQSELNQWKNIYQDAAKELKKEKSLTESVIEPMKNQLNQIDNTIREYNEMIDASRAQILQNNEKIYKLLTEE